MNSYVRAESRLIEKTTAETQTPPQLCSLEVCKGTVTSQWQIPRENAPSGAKGMTSLQTLADPDNDLLHLHSSCSHPQVGGCLEARFMTVCPAGNTNSVIFPL